MNNRSSTAKDADMRSFEGKILQEKYFLRNYIGQGNFGAVFKSEQYLLGIPIRRVAVKLSKQAGLNADTVKDILAEVFHLARAMDEMTDSEARQYLVHVFDAGIASEADDRGFFVMEYVQGTTLAEQFESYKRVPVNLLMKWMKQVCCAMRGLHSLVPPIIHRDLKPDNIRLGIDRNIRVIDFGIAAKLLKFGYVPGVAGTATYMAPETIKGESTPASDVYTMGLIIYEGLTGQLPFKQLIPPSDLPKALQNDWIYEQKSIIRLSPPSALNNNITPELSKLVLRCLEFNTSNRFRDAGELLEALEALDTVKLNPPDVIALDEGRHIKSTGDLKGARQSLEYGLDAQSSSKETRYALLRELGEVCMTLRDYKTAAERFVTAWNLVENTAILRTIKERVELLERIVEVYGIIKNTYMVNRYEEIINNLRTSRR